MRVSVSLSLIFIQLLKLMLSNKYSQLWLDISWILSRNVFVVSNQRHAGDYTVGDCLRLTLQTIAKLGNQLGVTGDKIIGINDSWAKEYGGYYRTYVMGGEYKNDRVYIDDLYCEHLREKEGVTEEEIQKAVDEAYMNKVKMEAKRAIKEELNNFGIACISYPGLEFDDIVCIASMMYSSGDITGRKPCCVVTKDSDMLRSISPCVHFFKYPKKGEEARIWTYDDVLKEIPQHLLDSGLSPYWYYCLLEALGDGHNAMKSPRKAHTKVSKVLEDIVLRGDYSDIEDKEMFDKSISTFDFSTYPMIGDVQDMITKKFMTCGRIGTLSEFKTFCDKYSVDGISDSYIARFFSRLDRSLYLDPAPEQRSL